MAMRDITVKMVVPTSGSFECSFMGRAVMRGFQASARFYLYLVLDSVFSINFSFRYIGELTLKKPLLKWREIINEKLPFYVIIFVLNDPGFKSVEILFLLIPVFVVITDTKLLSSGNTLPNVGYAKSPLFVFLIFSEFLYDEGIDKSLSKVLHGRLVFQHRTVDNKQPDRLPNLRRRQSDPLGMLHGFVHILNQEFQGSAGLHVFRGFSQYRIAIKDNRIYHISSALASYTTLIHKEYSL